MTPLELIAEAHADLKAVERVRKLEPTFSAATAISRIQAKLMSACGEMYKPRQENTAQLEFPQPSKGE